MEVLKEEYNTLHRGGVELTDDEIAQILHASKVGASILDYPVAAKIHIADGIELPSDQPSSEFVQSLAKTLGE